MTPREFVQQHYRAALEQANKLNVPVEGILAQAALESGFGAHTPGGNLFGIKGGTGPALPTQEFENGRMVTRPDRFRQYGSAAESFNDYGDLLSGKRYRGVRGAQSVPEFARALQGAGYATDPNYASKLSDIGNLVGKLLGTVVPAAQAGELPKRLGNSIGMAQLDEGETIDLRGVNQKNKSAVGVQSIGSLGVAQIDEGDVIDLSQKPMSRVEKQKQTPILSQGLANTVAKGALMNWQDELGAAAAALGDVAPTWMGGRNMEAPIGERYAARKEQQTQQTKEYESSHPVASAIGETLGGITSGLATGGLGTGALTAKMAPGIAKNAAQIVAPAMVAGGISGAGRAENISEIPEEAVKGSLTAGVTAGALGGGAKGLGIVGHKAWQAIRPLFGGDAYAERAAINELTDRILSSHPGLKMEEAEKLILDKLDELGPEGMLADVSKNLQGLAGTVGRAPGAGKEIAAQALGERAMQGKERVATELEQALKVSPEHLKGGNVVGPLSGDIVDSLKMIEEARKTAAVPAYQELYATEITPSRDLLNISSSSLGDKASKEILREMEDESIALGRKPPSFAEAIKSPEYWDLMKRKMQEHVNVAMKADRPSEARIPQKFAQQITDGLDALTKGKYREALGIAAEPLQLRSAMKTGEKILTTKEYDVLKTIQGMSDPAREAYKLASIQAVTNAAKNASANPLTALTMDKRLAAFRQLAEGDQAAIDKIGKLIEREKTFAGTAQSVFGGSQTAERLLEAQEAGGISEQAIKAGSSLFGLAKGKITDPEAWMNFTRSLDALIQVPNRRVREKMAKLLFATGDEAKSALDAIKQAQRTGILSPERVRKAKSLMAELGRKGGGVAIGQIE